MVYRHNPLLTQNAQRLRKSMTRQERHLWYDFLRKYPVRFLRQKVIDEYIVDFYCAQAGLSVIVLEKARFPRDKICGDGLTPRAVSELVTMGVPIREQDGWIRNQGLRVIGMQEGIGGLFS